MKTFKSFWIAVLTLLFLTACEKDSIDGDFTNEQSAELNFMKVEKSENANKGQLQNKVLNSEALKGNLMDNRFTRKLQVYTPPGYMENGSEQYPVVYLLHGFPFSEKAFVDRDLWDPFISLGFWQGYPDFPEEGFRQWMDNLIAEGTIDPMILVMPNAGASLFGFSLYSNSILNGDFEDFIVNDLVNYMDSHYNTIPDPSGRAVIGHSQGGYAAVKFGMLYPETFGTIASHSGLLFIDALFSPVFLDLLEQENPEGFMGPDPNKFLTTAGYAMSAAWSPNLDNPPFYVDLPIEFHADGHIYPIPDVVELWHQNDVFHLIDSHLDALYSLDGLYLDVGTTDELFTHLAHVPVTAKLDIYGIDYTYETYEGGHHTHLFERLAIALEFCSNHFN
ncbi:alpha/beta hydrolase [Salinimicrobium soli]|uniref:alpha/beta hydrolase n=1 Tax=Salinimicrobium soli TaxID=1254399 RepID=UPI003AAE22A7